MSGPVVADDHRRRERDEIGIEMQRNSRGKVPRVQFVLLENKVDYLHYKTLVNK
jgi:hypothetical protein